MNGPGASAAVASRVIRLGLTAPFRWRLSMLTLSLFLAAGSLAAPSCAGKEMPSTASTIRAVPSNTPGASQAEVPSDTQSPAPVPAEYQATYGNLKAALDAFETYLNSQGPPKNSTIFGAELLPANCNRGEELLQPGVMASVTLFLDRLQSLGVQGVTIPIHYPLYSPEFPRFAEYVAFYKQVVQEVRRRGMKLDVESHVIFANTPFSPIKWDYSKLTFDDYKTARRDVITRVINDLHPDFLNIGAEPDTEATLLGMKDLLDPQKYTDYISYLLDGLDRGNTKVVAGVGSWGNLDYARDLAAQTSLDGLSLHVYPVVGSSLTKMVEIANIARSHGKFIDFDECWLSKADVMPSNGVASSPEIMRRDAFSFWAPLDQEFLTTMAKYSRLYGVAYLSPFWCSYFFSYLDYSAQTATLNYPDTAVAEARVESQALRDGSFTSTGQLYRTLIAQNG